MADPQVRDVSADNRPPNLDEYVAWLVSVHGVEVEKWREHYRNVSERLRTDLSEAKFWSSVVSNLSDYADRYYSQQIYDLYVSKAIPTLQIKPFRSFLEKTFRKNVVFNANWPDAPDGGWLLPPNWYARIHDVIRTLVVVKYLDGVEFLISELETLCTNLELRFESSFEARDEGYYAAHILVYHPTDIPTLTFENFQLITSLEIQITTQLQEVIRRLTHFDYEVRRIKPRGTPESARPWQWDYLSDEFGMHYLGHILHYIEGMIMEIRLKSGTKE